MKVTINTTAPQSREIDWSKPMVVTNGDVYVITDGKDSGGCFSGVRLGTAFHYNGWVKAHFTPCTTPITVTFENEL